MIAKPESPTARRGWGSGAASRCPPCLADPRSLPFLPADHRARSARPAAGTQLTDPDPLCPTDPRPSVSHRSQTHCVPPTRTHSASLTPHRTARHEPRSPPGAVRLWKGGGRPAPLWTASLGAGLGDRQGWGTDGGCPRQGVRRV